VKNEPQSKAYVHDERTRAVPGLNIWLQNPKLIDVVCLGGAYYHVPLIAGPSRDLRSAHQPQTLNGWRLLRTMTTNYREQDGGLQPETVQCADRWAAHILEDACSKWSTKSPSPAQLRGRSYPPALYRARKASWGMRAYRHDRPSSLFQPACRSTLRAYDVPPAPPSSALGVHHQTVTPRTRRPPGAARSPDALARAKRNLRSHQCDVRILSSRINFQSATRRGSSGPSLRFSSARISSTFWRHDARKNKRR